MKKIILFLLFVNFLSAQTFDWVKVDSISLSTNPTSLLRSVDVDSNGNILSSRLIKSSGISSYTYLGDFIIEKFDPQGNLTWEKIITGKTNIIDILSDQNNNIFALGSYRDTIIIDSSHFEINTLSQTHGFVFKLNSSGQVLWLKDFMTTNPDINSLNAMNIDNSNNLWLSITKNFSSTALLKLDDQGAILQTINQTDVQVLSGIAFDPFNNIYVTGAAGFLHSSLTFNGYIVNAPFDYNTYIAKYSSSGSVQWVNFIEDITFQKPVVQTDNDGNAYLSASLHDSTSFGNIIAQGPQWVYDFFLTKIDSSGNFIWLNEVPNTTPFTGDAGQGTGQHINLDKDNNIYFTGLFRGIVDWGNGVISNENDIYPSILLNKYSSSGDILWTKTASSIGYDRGDDIAVDNDGNIYFTGITSDSAQFGSSIYPGAFASPFLAKVNPTATSIEQGYSKKIPGIIKLSQNYPNPFNPTTTIEFSILKNQFVTLKIYNNLGQEVATMVSENLPAGSYKYKWNAGHLASGTYICYLTTGTGFVQTRKLLLIK